MPIIWEETAAADYVPHHIDQSDALDSNSTTDRALSEMRVVSFTGKGQAIHVLLAKNSRAVRVNGQPVVGGLRVLTHKDEITIGLQRLVFSAESQPEVVAYAALGRDRPARCPICRGPLVDSQRVVRCPGCHRVYHEMSAENGGPAKPCWTYAPHCKFCGHTTALSAAALWRPENEELPSR